MSFSAELNGLYDSIMAADSVITEEFMIHQLSDRDNLDKTKGKELAQKAAENPNSLDATEWFIWRRTAIVKQSKKRTMRRKDFSVVIKCPCRKRLGKKQLYFFDEI